MPYTAHLAAMAAHREHLRAYLRWSPLSHTKAHRATAIAGFYIAYLNAHDAAGPRLP
jgi:hypothetical protein